ncbi:MAG: FeoB-associated Cys-rich membrane protein [Ruminococcaceae bacterium]|nr:FeoB-associated Cys-rich membrane protein [Oscillospiraceae bacterium]
MLLWLQSNWGTVLVAALLAATVYAIVKKIVRDKRAGRHLCGGSTCGGSCSGCSGCAMRGQCGKSA